MVSRNPRLCLGVPRATTSAFVPTESKEPTSIPCFTCTLTVRDCFCISTFSSNRQLARDLLNRTQSRFCQAHSALKDVAPPQVHWSPYVTRRPWTLRSLDVLLDIRVLTSKTVVCSLVPQLAFCQISDRYRTKVQMFLDGSTRNSTKNDFGRPSLPICLQNDKTGFPYTVKSLRVFFMTLSHGFNTTAFIET